MVDYLDDKKFKKDLEIALKLDKLESEIRKERKERRIDDLTFREANATAFSPITEAVKSIAELVKPQPKAMLAIEGPEERLPIQGSTERIPDNVSARTRETLLNAIAESQRDKEAYNVHNVVCEDNIFKLNGHPIIPVNDHVIVNDKPFKLTPGLAYLMTQSSLKTGDGVNENDAYNYVLMLRKAGVNLGNTNRKLKMLSQHGITRIGGRWYRNNVLIDFNHDSEREVPTTGRGIRLLPSNPMSLNSLLSTRLAAYKAGNKGLRNEIIAISDELLRQGAIEKSDYKRISMTL